jgi:hypothetical protein
MPEQMEGRPYLSMIKISPHAEKQIVDRSIEAAWVEATRAAPDLTEPDPIAGRTRLFRSIPEFGGRVLRVVIESKEGAESEAVTVRFHRAATKRRSRQ